MIAAMLSVVIPTLNAGRTLAGTLEALRCANRLQEVIVADAGSADGTADVARQFGAKLIETAPGRGGQLIAGASAAAGDWFLFLHADTRLEPGWADEAEDFMARQSNAEKAGVFRFALDDDSPQAHRLQRMVGWRARRLALPYGDQGLLISRALYESLGGYRPLPLMEDVDLIRRIGRGRIVLLRTRAITSADRYRRDGYLWRSTRNLFCLALYYVGVPAGAIARIYR